MKTLKPLCTLLFATLATASAALPDLNACTKLRELEGFPSFILPGKDDRLFGNSSFDYSFTSLMSNGMYYRRMASILRDQGTHLITMQTPPVSLVYPETVDWMDPIVSKRTELARDKPLFHQMQQAFQTYGFGSIDLLRVAEDFKKTNPGKLFIFRRDHHWTPDGAQASAKAFAAYLKEHYSAEFASLPKFKYDLKTIQSESLDGSYAQKVKQACDIELPKESYTRFELQNGPEQSLLGDETPPIVLLSDSYGVDRFSFPAFLSVETGLAVTNGAVSGGGPTDALLNYFLQRNSTVQAPKFIAWLFLGRPQAPSFYRQLLPSMYNAKQAGLLVASTTKLANGPIGLTVPPSLAPKGENGYVRLQLTDLVLKKFVVDIKYSDGATEAFTIERSDRIRNTGVFFLELDPTKGQVSTVTAQIPSKTTGDATLSVYSVK